ncbi:hypothetical protein ACGFIK_02350 [Micromonospora sp. NPDC048871]|uniref:hypothetical protein n=1 Tax=unclassified Micromonospora TaxID=2617518 RepID=UPI002E152297|nr:hypothetical protein OIE53_16140 [Micromonospora sp. NBC_01739]
MDIKVWMYLVYLVVSIGLTIWVARTLARNGLVFLQEVFADERLANAVNNLLVVGFYLLNLGYVTVAMRHSGLIESTSEAMEELSWKIGLVLLVLGALHFFNVFTLNRYRKSRLRQLATAPPLPPAGYLPRQQPHPAAAPPAGHLPRQHPHPAAAPAQAPTQGPAQGPVQGGPTQGSAQGPAQPPAPPR